MPDESHEDQREITNRYGDSKLLMKRIEGMERVRRPIM